MGWWSMISGYKLYNQELRGMASNKAMYFSIFFSVQIQSKRHAGPATRLAHDVSRRSPGVWRGGGSGSSDS